MRRSESSLSRIWPIAVALGATLLAACFGETELKQEALKPCGGQALVGGNVAKQYMINHTLGPCIVAMYADSIGTDTTTFLMDSIGTDTTSSDATRAPCTGRLVVNGGVISEKTSAIGPCFVRFYLDSIGTDTTTTPARLRFRLDSIGTDTAAAT